MKKIKAISMILSATMLLALVLTLFTGTAYADVQYSGIANMSMNRGYYPAAALLDDGRVLVVGGQQSSSASTNTAEIYNPATNSWSRAASCLTANYRYGSLKAVTLNDGRVLIAGGDVYGDGVWGLKTTQIFDPDGDDGDPNTEGAWSYGADMHAQRTFPSLIKLNDGRVLVSGGMENDTRLGFASAEIYDPSQNTWTFVASMNQGRMGHGSTLLSDGRVLVAGGDDDDVAFGRLRSCEIYDPVDDTWTTVSPFPLEPGNETGGKTAMALVTLSDGRAFMLGGNSGAGGSVGADRETYYYYPDTDTWVKGPLLPESFKKSRGAVTQLADGTVFFAGGGDDASSYVNTAFTIFVEEPTLEPTTGLSINPGTLSPAYHKDTISYTAMNGTSETFPNSQDTLDVTPVSDDPLLKDIKVNGVVTASGSPATVNLDPGLNKIYVDVTDTDDITRRYTVDVTREGNLPTTKTVLEDCSSTNLLGVNGVNISGIDPSNPAYGTWSVVEADADNRFDDILYMPALGYSGTFTINYTTFTGDKSIDVTVTETHDVTFRDYDNSVIETRTIVDGQPISSDGGAVSDLSRAHYNFDGWDMSGTDYTSAQASDYVPMVDTTFTAEYTIDQHTIELEENGGAIVLDITEDYGTAIAEVDLGTTTRPGYVFDKWYEDDVTFNTEVVFPYTLAGDDIWYANWNPVEYSVTYNLNGGTNDISNPSTYNIETTTITLADASRPNYSFNGWYTDENCTSGNEITEIASGSIGDVTVWADWGPVAYDITYNLNGGTNSGENPNTYTVESSTITFAYASREGYDFGGWYTDKSCTSENEITKILNGSTGDVEVWAKWNIKNYDIMYNLCGGTNDRSNPETYTVESALITFADAVRTGYDFDGWYTDENCTSGNEITEIASGSIGDVIVWADWTPTEYAITYNLDGGTNNPGNKSSYTVESKGIPLGEPSKSGYLFGGWYTTGEFTSGTEINEIETGSTGDVTVWVKWIELNSSIENQGAVKGTLLTSDGQPVVGVAVTLHSMPRTVFTDEHGSFKFDNVEFTDHTLVIKNSDGDEVGNYALDFSKGSNTLVVIDGSQADITYKNNTVTVHLDISMDKSGTGTTLDDITVIGNPDTGEDTAYKNNGFFWLGISLVIMAFLAGALVITACIRANQKEA